MRQTPRPIRHAAIAKLKVQSNIFLPKFLKRIRVGKTETKFTNPRRAVTTVGFIPVDFRIVLE